MPAVKQLEHSKQSTDVSTKVLLLLGLAVLILVTVLLGKEHIERRRQKRSHQQREGVGFEDGAALSLLDDRVETEEDSSTHTEDTSAAGISPSLATKSESGVDLGMPDQQSETGSSLVEAVTVNGHSNSESRVNTGSSKQKYGDSYKNSSDFVSEEHLKIVENEMKLLSSQATRALEEVGG